MVVVMRTMTTARSCWRCPLDCTCRMDVLGNRGLFAEDIADFVKVRTGLGVSEVARPKLLDSVEIKVALGILAGGGGMSSDVQDRALIALI